MPKLTKIFKYLGLHNLSNCFIEIKYVLPCSLDDLDAKRMKIFLVDKEKKIHRDKKIHKIQIYKT